MANLCKVFRHYFLINFTELRTRLPWSFAWRKFGVSYGEFFRGEIFMSVFFWATAELSCSANSDDSTGMGDILGSCAGVWLVFCIIY